MDKTKRKINVIGKICRILAVIFTVLMIISASMLVLTGAALCFVPDSAVSAKTSGAAEVTVSGDWIKSVTPDQVEQFSKEIEEGSYKISLESGKVEGAEKKDDAIVLRVNGAAPDFTLRRVGLMLLVYSAIPGCLIYVGFTLKGMMKELEKCESPFSEGVVKGMTHFAISLIPYAVIHTGAASLAKQLLTSGSFDMDFSLDLTVVFAVLVIVLLILIFKYGVALQKESDETL